MDQNWYVAARFRCVVVKASDSEQALFIAQPILERLGVVFETHTKVIVRPATDDEVELHSAGAVII